MNSIFRERNIYYTCRMENGKQIRYSSRELSKVIRLKKSFELQEHNAVKLLGKEIADLKRLKNQKGLTNEYISFETGLDISAVARVFSGQTKKPRKMTMELIKACINK